MAATSAPGPGYALHRPLPDDVLVGGNTVWSRYRRYPVFSGPWLRGRTLLFALAIGLFALATALGVGVSSADYRAGLFAGAHLFAAFLLMATAGPALATWVRYRHWPLRRERRMVVAAVLAGVALSGLVDWWASSQVEQIAAGVGPARPSRAPLEGAARLLALGVNLVFLLVVYGLFGGGLALRAYFSERRRWERSEQGREMAELRAQTRQSELRLGVLQAQVEPHFLFNTLASVRALVRQDPARAEATLDALVEHLRATIPKLRDDGALLHSTLGQQLDICRSYLELMRLRIGERLRYAIDADPSLRARPFPPLLLITLVENAIKHGVEPRPGEVAVRVSARVDGERLLVEVSDDGAGLVHGVGGGVGLANVREQLAVRYGDRAGLRLAGRPGGGAAARIHVPLQAPPP
ncbi:histidine kinase [Luteimonas sp. RD2P54]|uniref:histidine kinase n=1 Tax=Luteimonas endophytica TaxID=3042023 RepID=A0ABT6JAN3_9GAMM|nr:histidine kinase [Luteimonas endophytica]MDH5823891.1 histidine kinase [Luteimonas endophytica]